MKNKKKIIFTILLFIVAILLVISGVFLLKKAKNKDENNQTYGVIGIKEYEFYKVLLNASDLFLINSNDSIKVINEQGDSLLEFSVSDYGYLDSYHFEHNKSATYISINKNNMIYDKDFNKVIEDKSDLALIYDEVLDEAYYLKDKNLYNLKNELVCEKIIAGKIDDYFYELYGDYLIIFSHDDNYKNQIINIKTKDKYEFKVSSNLGNNLLAYTKEDVLEKGKNVYFIDHINNTLQKYDNYKKLNYGVLLFNDNQEEKVLLTNDQVVKYGDNLTVKDYKLDYSVCENGFKVYDKDGTLIEDSCYDFYVANNDENYLELFKDGIKDDGIEDYISYYLYNNKIYNYRPVGKFFIDNNLDYDGIKIYDENEEEIKGKCSLGFGYYQSGMYYCTNDYGSYLVDESFNKVSNLYEEIYCQNSKCVITRNGKSGLLINNEVVLEPIYNDVQISDGDLVLAEEAYGIKLLLLGNGEVLSKDEIDKKIEPNIDISDEEIENIIKENELNKNEDLINENEDLFKKYAYFVEKNKQLGKYKKYVYDSFTVVAENKEYLDESSFFPSLMNLYIVDKSDEENLKANGYYYDYNNKIEIFKNWDSVIYHELMHFIDFKINQDKSLSIYSYNDGYIDEDAYFELADEEKEKAEFLGITKANFITEGGAEINTGMYLDNNLITTYTFQVNIYSILNYIYGSEFMNEVYFGVNGENKLFEKFVEAGYSYKDYSDFISKTSYYSKNDEKIVVEVYDMLIGLYEAQGNGKWYEDKVLSTLIKNGLGYYEIKAKDTSRYDEYQKIKFDFDSIEKQFVKEYGDKYYTYIKPSPMIYNNELFVSFNIYDNTPLEGKLTNRKYYVAKYDVYTNSLSDYIYIEE